MEASTEIEGIRRGSGTWPIWLPCPVCGEEGGGIYLTEVTPLEPTSAGDGGNCFTMSGACLPGGHEWTVKIASIKDSLFPYVRERPLGEEWLSK